jgi:hypothetical protein
MPLEKRARTGGYRVRRRQETEKSGIARTRSRGSPLPLRPVLARACRQQNHRLLPDLCQSPTLVSNGFTVRAWRTSRSRRGPPLHARWRRPGHVDHLARGECLSNPKPTAVVWHLLVLFAVGSGFNERAIGRRRNRNAPRRWGRAHNLRSNERPVQPSQSRSCRSGRSPAGAARTDWPSSRLMTYSSCMDPPRADFARGIGV